MKLDRVATSQHRYPEPAMYQVKLNYSNPPVIEVAASVQFAPIKGIASGHFGLYWDHLGRTDWPNIRESNRIAEQEERFGVAIPPQKILFHFDSSEGAASLNRLQIRNEAEDRMIQVQDTRFVLNWIKQESRYPRYATIRSEFAEKLEGFRGFIATEKLGDLRLNQWELTYVNHIPAGDLWTDVPEWPSILPGLLGNSIGPTRFESLNGQWRSVIGENQGRLHTVVRVQEKKRGKEVCRVLVLHMTARGPIPETGVALDGLDIGHDAIVETFAAITSTAAQRYWGKEETDA